MSMRSWPRRIRDSISHKGSLSDLGLVLRLLPGEVWMYENYVHPAYRGAGVHRASRAAFDRLCLQQGIRWKLSAATLGRRPDGRDNPFIVATTRTLRLGPLRRFWVRTYGPEAEYWRERLKELRWA